MKINIPPLPSPTLKPNQKTSSIDAAAPTNKEKLEAVTAQPFVERRKKNSDRRGQANPRGPFDMRSGRDRRKNSGRHPSIEVDV